MSVIDVKAKAFFERLYLVPGLGTFGPFVTMPSAPTSPPLDLRLFLDFYAIFFPSGPSIFLVSTIRQVIWPGLGTGYSHGRRLSRAPLMTGFAKKMPLFC